LEIYKFVEVASGEWVMTLETQKVPESTGPNEYAGDEADSSLILDPILSNDQSKYLGSLAGSEIYMYQDENDNGQNITGFFSHKNSNLLTENLAWNGSVINFKISPSKTAFASEAIKLINTRNSY